MKKENSNRTLVLWLLTIVYMMNFIDRQIIGILSPAIQAELGFTDSQLGWLKGFAFALLYVLAGIPLAWLADRYNRTRIVAISLTVWSGFTALTGMAGSYMAMLFARIGVGIGEAGGSPPSHSIISDLYPKEKRASALGIYSLGIPLGIGFSYLLAGILIEALGWRGMLKALGVAGVILAIILVIVVREPERGQQESSKDGDSKDGDSVDEVPFREGIKTLLSIPSWWAMCFGIAFVSFGGYAVTNWGIDYLVRYDASYALGTSNFSNLLFKIGLINFVAFGAGTYYGAVITEKLAKKSVSAYGWVPAVALIFGSPALIAAFWVDSITLHLTLLCIYLIAAGVYLGPSFAAAQTLAPVNMRAMSTALFFLILNIIALGGGPTIVGIISQHLTPEHGSLHGLRLALTCLSVTYILSIISFFWAAKTMPKDWAEAEARNEG